jgi:hypothetical protein
MDHHGMQLVGRLHQARVVVHCADFLFDGLHTEKKHYKSVANVLDQYPRAAWIRI